MESSTTSAVAGMSLQWAEHTPPARRLTEAFNREQAGIGQAWLRLSLGPRVGPYDSWASPSVLSSMLMSLSSLDSKTSRHSRHSTNSASSSRLTICTRGCLQGCLPEFCGRGNGFEVISAETMPHRIRGGTDSREFPGILALLLYL